MYITCNILVSKRFGKSNTICVQRNVTDAQNSREQIVTIRQHLSGVPASVARNGISVKKEPFRETDADTSYECTTMPAITVPLCYYPTEMRQASLACLGTIPRTEQIPLYLTAVPCLARI